MGRQDLAPKVPLVWVFVQVPGVVITIRDNGLESQVYVFIIIYLLIYNII